MVFVYGTHLSPLKIYMAQWHHACVAFFEGTQYQTLTIPHCLALGLLSPVSRI